MRWGLCGNKDGPCRIDSSLAERHENLIKILESDAVFYLEPIFLKPGVDVSVVKTVDNASPLGSEIVNFTVKVTNLGQEIATRVAVTDPLPDSLELKVRPPTQFWPLQA